MSSCLIQLGAGFSGCPGHSNSTSPPGGLEESSIGTSCEERREGARRKRGTVRWRCGHCAKAVAEACSSSWLSIILLHLAGVATHVVLRGHLSVWRVLCEQSSA